MPWIDDARSERHLATRFAIELRSTVLSLIRLVDRNTISPSDIAQAEHLKAAWRRFYQDSALYADFRAPGTASAGWSTALRWTQQRHLAFGTLDITQIGETQGRFGLPVWLAQRLCVEDVQEWSTRFYQMSRSWQEAFDELCDRLHLVCVNPWATARPQWRVVIETFDVPDDSYTAISLTNHDTGISFTVSNVTENYDPPGRTASAPAVVQMMRTIHTTLTSGFDVPL
jgi:hypothetical protein